MHPVMGRLVRPTLVPNWKGLVVVALDTDYLRSIDFVSLAGLVVLAELVVVARLDYTVEEQNLT